MIVASRLRLTQQIALQGRLAADIARAQADLATQKRLQGPSDDPVAAARVADIQRAQQNRAAWSGNVAAARATADRLDTSMASLGDQLDRAKELMLKGANGTLSPSDRSAIAAELAGIAEDVDALAIEKDSRGLPLYSVGNPLVVPVGAGVTVRAAASRDGIFDDIATAGGPKSLAAIFAGAATALASGSPAAISLSLDEFDAAANSVADAHAEQGVRAARLVSIEDRLAEAGLIDAEERSGLEDTDIDATVIRLQSKMTALKAAQAVLSRTLQDSLFDRI